MRGAEQIIIMASASQASSFPFSPGNIAPSHDIDFAGNRAWVNGTGFVSPASLLTVTRASQETITDALGNLSYAANNVAALSGAGLQVWEARTNVVLWDNDLTNVAWTAANTTAAKDQTGPDNVLNSASSILATAGNATILQAITLSSSARFQTAYVKRLVGSGAINMTMDNGTTWTAVAVTAGWTRVSVPTQTLANPVVGFRIVTNGDKIAVALVQNENGAFASPGIPTTTAAVARAADVIKLTTPPSFGSAYSSVVWGTPAAPVNYAQPQATAALSDGTATNRVVLERAATNAFATIAVVSGGSNIYVGSGVAWGQGALGKLAAAYASGAQRAVFNSVPITPGTGVGLSGINTVEIGNRGDGLSPFDGNISRLVIWPSTALSASALQQVTQ